MRAVPPTNVIARLTAPLYRDVDFKNNPISLSESSLPGATSLHSPNLVGKRFGNYEIQRQIGEGSTATIWTTKLVSGEGPDVVVKAMKVSADPESNFRYQAMIAHEAMVLDRVKNHGNIVRSYGGTILDDNRPVLLLKHLIGATLHDFIKVTAGNPDYRDHFRRIFFPICGAVHHCNLNGVIVRDVKPLNVFLHVNFPKGSVEKLPTDLAGTVMPEQFPLSKVFPFLLDMGFAKETSEWGSSSGAKESWRTLSAFSKEARSPNDTKDGDVKGTANYMAPEQLVTHDFDARIDQFALATIAYYWVSGRHPFADGVISEEVVLGRLLNGEFLGPPHALNKSVSPEMSAVIMKGLSLNPEHRYTDALTFGKALSLAMQFSSCDWKPTKA